MTKNIALAVFLFFAVGVSGFLMGTKYNNDVVTTSWGTGHQDEDDLVIKVDGQEVYRTNFSVECDTFEVATRVDCSLPTGEVVGSYDLSKVIEDARNGASASQSNWDVETSEGL